MKKRLLHGLGRQLGGEDAEALLDGHSVSRELVIGGEASRVSRLGQQTIDGLLLERVDALAILIVRPATTAKRQRRVSQPFSKHRSEPRRRQVRWSGTYLVFGEHEMHFGECKSRTAVQRWRGRWVEIVDGVRKKCLAG